MTESLPADTVRVGDQRELSGTFMHSDNLTTVLKRSLGAWSAHGARIARLLDEYGMGFDVIEASVRHGRGQSCSGGRMMIARLDSRQARAVLSPLVSLPPIAEKILEVATSERLLTIAGWDVSSRPVAKLYLNASDASVATRTRARRALIGHTEGPEAPHVIGLNLSHEGTEVKLYEQNAHPWEDTPRPLAEWAATQPASGFVRSTQIGEGGPRPKAWFVGLRGSAGAFAPSWPGSDRASIIEAAPFEPGRITSVGISSSSAPHWTVYFKPTGQALSWSLEPVASFSDGTCEVGLYLEPSTPARRAYARTERWSISFRLREGKPRRAMIERLMSWYLETVETHTDDPASHLHSPPEPWYAVD